MSIWEDNALSCERRRGWTKQGSFWCFQNGRRVQAKILGKAEKRANKIQVNMIMEQQLCLWQSVWGVEKVRFNPFVYVSLISLLLPHRGGNLLLCGYPSWGGELDCGAALIHCWSIVPSIEWRHWKSVVIFYSYFGGEGVLFEMIWKICLLCLSQLDSLT